MFRGVLPVKPGNSASGFEADDDPIAARYYRGGEGFEKWGARFCFKGNQTP